MSITIDRVEPAPPRMLRWAAMVLEPVMDRITLHQWSGQENIPTSGGFVAACNHTSYADPLPFAHFLYASGVVPYFLGKSSLFQLPLVGHVLHGAGQIPVKRDSEGAAEAYREAVAVVREGKCVALYPEGTFTHDPGLWPMTAKTGAARIALTTGAPVIPVGQWGPQQILGPTGRLPRVFPRPLLQFCAGTAVDLDDLRGKPLDAEILRDATDRIMESITGLVAELRGEDPPAEPYDARSGSAT